MKYFASYKYARISPKKARLIAKSLKKSSAVEIENILKYSPNKSAKIILKLLKSAISNAKNKKADIEKLFLSEIKIDAGPILKRRKIRSKGRADLMKRRTSHISIILEDMEKKETKANDKIKKSNKDFSKKIRNPKHEILNKSQITKSKKTKQKV